MCAITISNYNQNAIFFYNSTNCILLISCCSFLSKFNAQLYIAATVTTGVTATASTTAASIATAAATTNTSATATAYTNASDATKAD